ncbi:MAG: FxSxx-COOH system tetratricopeptide repeat protein [Trebonia sp.]
MSDVLNDNRVNLPEWRFVAEFVKACHAASGESGLDVAELGTMADWKRHWDSAYRGVIGARFPGQGQPSAIEPDLAEASSDLAASDAGTVLPAGEVATGSDGTLPSIWGPVPPRVPDFVGRHPWLTEMRRALTAENRRTVVTVQGMLGIGKTQLAIEYAHRYAREYDLVWWVPCRDAQAAHGAMADLAARLGVGGAERAPSESESDYAGLFDTLRRGEPYGSWLLIFDNADEPDQIRHLIPPLRGHVLVTSRNSSWEATAEMLELDVFERAESIEFQRRRMRKFSVTAAHQLADAVGDLPILLEHAAESQVAADQYIAWLKRDPLGLLDGQPSDYQGTIAGEWQAVLGQFGDHGPDSLDLLACLCFFSDEPIPQESLERGSHRQDISIHGVLFDPIRRSRAIRMLRRAGLLRVRTESRTLEVHQSTRHVVRAMVRRRGAADVKRSRHDVHLLLAAADPLDPEDPANWRGYDQLRGHAARSQLHACGDESVRRLAVNLARYLTAIGDPRAALSLARDALARWTADGASGLPGAAGACLTMQQAKAAALLARGQAEDAFQLQDETLAAMRATPGTWEREIVLLGRITGAHGRMTGNFRGAQLADQESAQAHVTEFDRDDPHTFPALNSVIANLVLSGKHADAAREAQRVYGDCLAYYKHVGFPAVLFQQNVVGRCLWLCGRYDEAVSILAEVKAGYTTTVNDGTIDENHPWCLTHEVDYAVARRDKGLPGADLRVLADAMHHVRRRCWRALGADHPQTLAATVALGSILRRADGRAGEAARVLADAERRYQAVLPNHPYTHACRGFAATIRHLTGDHGDKPGLGPVSELEDAAASLARSVGARHPLTLIAASSLASVLADTGEPDGGNLDAALRQAQETLAACAACFGPGHPLTLACEANVATIRSRLHHEADFGDLLTRYKAAVGPDHPDVRLFTERKLIFLDFTPTPL